MDIVITYLRRDYFTVRCLSLPLSIQHLTNGCEAVYFITLPEQAKSRR